MLNYKEQQSLLLMWFSHYGIRSESQIRIASIQILNSFSLDINNSLYKVFYPLVRMGLIEFIGIGKYQISKAAVLYYPKLEICVAYGLSNQQKVLFLEKYEKVDQDMFGVMRFHAKKSNIKILCKIENIDYYEPNIINELSNFPCVKNIVSKFDDAVLPENGEYYNVMKYEWKYSSIKRYGIYRCTRDSLKIYLRTEKYGDLSITDSAINPEFRNIAELYHLSRKNKSYLFYNKKEMVLSVTNVNIPILLERVLRSLSFYKTSHVEKSYNILSFSNIPCNAVSQLNRILNTTIIEKNE